MYCIQCGNVLSKCDKFCKKCGAKIVIESDSILKEEKKSRSEAIGNGNYHTLLFRFPGGSSGGPDDSLKATAKQYLAENNIASTNWNCLSRDKKFSTQLFA